MSAAESRSARYERLGSPGSKPWTTSNRPRASASERLARTPTGTPIRLRREIRTAGPMAISSGELVEGAEQRAPAGGEIAGAVRRSEDGDRVAASPQLAREPVHVLVHVVRLRPGERRDERDPHVDRV